ncbi:MAG: hypothetical protein ACYCSN_15745 [Acidobacteriaceae bacterium]
MNHRPQWGRIVERTVDGQPGKREGHFPRCPPQPGPSGSFLDWKRLPDYGTIPASAPTDPILGRSRKISDRPKKSSSVDQQYLHLMDWQTFFGGAGKVFVEE